MTTSTREASCSARLEPIETASRDEISSLQLDRLKRSLRRAYERVPHYRTAFDTHGVHPDDVRDLADLARFPFLTKDAYRATYPLDLLAVPRSEVRRLHASSGTTGKPTVVAYTQNDIDMWADVVARSIRAAGGRPGDTVHIAYGYGLFTGGLGMHYGAERLGCTVIPMSGGQTEKQIQLIADLGPRIIMITPSYMLALLDEMEHHGIDPRRSGLEIGMFGAEPWTESMRTRLEHRAGIDALDIYGLSEIIGPGVAQECIETKDGLHIWEDHFYPEIVDPVTGAVLPDGESGELVITSLTKEAMPVVRYRTRDLTRLLPGTARSMRRIQKITGRCDDMLIVRGVNVFPTQIEEIVLRDDRLAPQYQLRLTRARNLDELTVVVEPVSERVDGSACSQLLRDRIKKLIGISATVECAAAGSIPQSQGKAKHVFDLREPGKL
jgi:phenylacetate-CoA ligase